jgi:hypothetical protein
LGHARPTSRSNIAASVVIALRHAWHLGCNSPSQTNDILREEHTMARVQRIVHASDFSKASRAAFDKAVELAKSNRAELVLVHVLGPVVPFVADGFV